ncbi:MAG: response regulator [Lachnospiraceae bacterium]|nr:response regulator [Lachnospiraceae bacterium]
MSKVNRVLEYISHVREKSKVVNQSGLYTAFSLISIYALIMSAVCFIKSDIIMGVVNAIIAVTMIVTMLLFARIKSPKMLSWFVVSSIYVLMMFFMYQGGVGGVSIMWLLFVPVGGMALINLYYGGILSFLIGVSIPLYMLTPLHRLGYQYSEDYRIRFPIIYWAFLIMSLVIFIRIDRFEEEQKELIRKADDANRSKSEFLADMSHEIRTPMNAIMGLCELNMNEDLSSLVRDNSENIYRSSKGLMNIINNLLDFSKVESGKMELQCSEYKLSDVLEDVMYMTTARMGDKDLEFVVDCDPDIPNLLYGDEVRIKQIIINLLTNALKYTEKGGFLLTLTGRKETYGINLAVSVKDSGIGIQKEYIGKIFDTYRRVDIKKNRSVEGTGLGLPITKRLVTLMNGVIRVKSEYGKGTEFKIIIPQRVIDETPIVTVGRSKTIRILYYHVEEVPDFIGESYYHSFKSVIRKWNASGQVCHSLEQFKNCLSNGTYTHIIIGKDEYLADRGYYDALSKSYHLAVVQERMAPVSVGGNIQCIYKPFYTRNFSDFINQHQRYLKKRKLPATFAARGARILVVDDNLLNLKVMEGHLKPYEVQVDTAMNGMEAIEMIKQMKYDLVFMDHMMPEMDGIETHHNICLLQRDYVETMPIVALTANVAGDARQLFMEEGFQDFMSKPIQSDGLKEMLLKWLPKDLIINKEEYDE